MKRLVRQIRSYEDSIYIIDGFPISVCQITRATKSRCFRGEAGYTADIQGLLLGDKVYIHSLLSEELKWQAIDLQTPLRKNMKDSRDKAFVQQLMSARRFLENVT